MADTTIAAIQTINAGISGITTAWTDVADYPFPVPAEALPCVLTLPARFEAGKMPLTTYGCLVLVAQMDRTTQIDALSTAMDLLRGFRAAYRGLGSVGGYAVRHVHPTRQTGTGAPDGLWKTVAWAGAEFIGFMWDVTLMEAP